MFIVTLFIPDKMNNKSNVCELVDDKYVVVYLNNRIKGMKD